MLKEVLKGISLGVIIGIALAISFSFSTPQFTSVSIQGDRYSAFPPVPESFKGAPPYLKAPPSSEATTSELGGHGFVDLSLLLLFSFLIASLASLLVYLILSKKG